MRFNILQRASSLACVLILTACASAPVPMGYYRVQRGDTLSQIAQRNGTTVRDLARWNQISNPNLLEVDQVLRVMPPSGQAAPATRTANGNAAAPSPPVAPPASGSRPAVTAVTRGPTSTLTLVWPTSGQVLHRFGQDRNKGIDIPGQAGQPVFAAAAGKVVYAGNSLRGYGNLLIIKHNADYLTAYAHNRALLVKEGQSVTQGEQIAEMGSTDTDRVMLHFEVRYEGKTINPMSSLPPR